MPTEYGPQADPTATGSFFVAQDGTIKKPAVIGTPATSLRSLTRSGVSAGGAVGLLLMISLLVLFLRSDKRSPKKKSKKSGNGYGKR